MDEQYLCYEIKQRRGRSWSLMLVSNAGEELRLHCEMMWNIRRLRVVGFAMPFTATIRALQLMGALEN